MSRAETVDDYLHRFAEADREVLDQLRALASDAAPQAREAIKWGHPAWVHPSGTILFVINGHTKHANVVFTPSTRAAFDEELADRATGKSSVRLPYGQPIPVDLLRRMIAHRAREHEEQGVLWM